MGTAQAVPFGRTEKLSALGLSNLPRDRRVTAILPSVHRDISGFDLW